MGPVYGVKVYFAPKNLFNFFIHTGSGGIS